MQQASLTNEREDLYWNEFRGRFRACRLYNIISTRPCNILDVYRGPEMNTKANYLLYIQ